RRLVARLLEKDPARRPADAAEVADALAGPPRRLRLLPIVAVSAAARAGTAVLVWQAARPRPEWRPITRELRPGLDEDIRHASFSPDGTQIAYASERSGGWRLYLDGI